MAEEDPTPLGRIWTLTEAADYLRMTKQAISRTARKHGLCTVHGRELLFSDSDILAIWDAKRCPSGSSNVKAATTGTSVALSEDKVFSNLRALVMAERQKRLEARKRRG